MISQLCSSIHERGNTHTTSDMAYALRSEEFHGDTSKIYPNMKLRRRKFLKINTWLPFSQKKGALSNKPWSTIKNPSLCIWIVKLEQKEAILQIYDINTITVTPDLTS